jgi:hypothetical protein
MRTKRQRREAMQVVRAVIARTVLMVAMAHTAIAQTTTGSEPSQCYGFAFGAWTPALDWQLAGHGAPVDSARVPRAPNGRGWAAIDVEPQSDSTLLLFPPWWPAGISVKFATKPASPNDTIAGRAVALVADGRKRPPTTAVKLWRVPCGH